MRKCVIMREKYTNDGNPNDETLFRCRITRGSDRCRWGCFCCLRCYCKNEVDGLLRLCIILRLIEYTNGYGTLDWTFFCRRDAHWINRCRRNCFRCLWYCGHKQFMDKCDTFKMTTLLIRPCFVVLALVETIVIVRVAFDVRVAGT